MTKAKDELTTQSDDTLDELVTISDRRFNRFNDELIDKYFNDEGKKAIDAYAAAQNLALLTRLEARARYFDTLNAKKPWEVKAIPLTALQSERALIEKRMM